VSLKQDNPRSVQGEAGRVRPATLPLVSPFMCPPDLKVFVGRAEELATLAVSLSPGAVVGICGLADVSGVGKTTLAIRAAHLLRDRFPDGVFWAVPSRQTTTDILQSLATACGLSDFSDFSDLPSRMAVVRGMLSVRRALVILDDVQSEDQVVPLLVGGQCTVLVTTRRKGLLPLPQQTAQLELAEFSPREALTFFEQCWTPRQVELEQEAVKAICKLLGHLPLALSLVTARLAWRRDLRAATLLRQLQIVEQRLQTQEVGRDQGVRVAFDASYEALTEREQLFFDALGALGGADFDPPAAAAAAEAWRVDELEALEALKKLSELSLVQPGRGPGRYTLHHRLRGYALGHLRERHDDTPFRAVIRHYLDLIRLAWGQARGPESSGSLAVIDREIDNIRAARSWAVDKETPEALELIRDCASEDVSRYFRLRGLWSDWIEWGEAGMLACTVLRDVRNWIAIANSLGQVYTSEERWDKAIDVYRKSLAAFERVENPRGLAQAWGNLGNVYGQQGDWEQASEAYRRSLEIFENLGDARDVARTQGNLGNVYAAREDWERARESYRRALAGFIRVGDQPSAAQTYLNLGGIYMAQEEWLNAQQAYDNALKVFKELGDYPGQALALNNLGNVYARLRKWDGSVEAYEQAVKVLESLHDAPGLALACLNLGNVYIRQAEWDKAVEVYHRSLSIFEELNYVYGMAQVYNNLGLLYRQQGRRDEARDCLRRAAELFRQLGLTHDAEEVSRWLDELTPQPEGR
jgi:tetratricopeptide (TPR) repeat protein